LDNSKKNFPQVIQPEITYRTEFKMEKGETKNDLLGQTVGKQIENGKHWRQSRI